MYIHACKGLSMYIIMYMHVACKGISSVGTHVDNSDGMEMDHGGNE